MLNIGISDDKYILKLSPSPINNFENVRMFGSLSADLWSRASGTPASNLGLLYDILGLVKKKIRLYSSAKKIVPVSLHHNAGSGVFGII